MALVVLALLLITIYPWSRLGSEFMPPLDEGSILFMPITVPGISIEEAKRLVQAQDKILKAFPEVERVFGKAGRAETGGQQVVAAAVVGGQHVGGRRRHGTSGAGAGRQSQQGGEHGKEQRKRTKGQSHHDRSIASAAMRGIVLWYQGRHGANC